MRIERLITMANDIATYFTVEPDHAAAVASVRDHLTRFWDPVMRRQLKSYLADGGEGLIPLAQEAVSALQLPPVDAT
ncbi:formate dehydrogenase subunit delta [Dyella kyungheensis]|jgi:formate dehydrogenase subunit delta|uniref:Formate dehydrogenase subunit delta n=1 Tax=Dyella kyungheensis TaxID=1242174 RepID=A0ABS2JPS5_9GAMM|nr:formate dehydrogenase subunit delta [Dyella kyungheensis]MBM7121019.1 formate dehydrogenase subunit delta [Dyella kyungheensis]